MQQVSTCQFCTKEFYFNPYHKTGKFCSNKCRGDYTVSLRLKQGTTIDYFLRKWIYNNLEQKCVLCGQGTLWNGKFLRLQIDHVNGDVHDNRKENLRMICPNCHTQTENWGAKNASDEGRKRMRDGVMHLRSLRK